MYLTLLWTWCYGEGANWPPRRCRLASTLAALANYIYTKKKKKKALGLLAC